MLAGVSRPTPLAMPAVAVGVVGEHDRDPALGRGQCGARRAQAAASSATKPDPVGDRREAHDAGSRCADRSAGAALNATARVRIRPSTSGSATFIARSRGERPRVPSRQAASLPPASTSCSTARPGSSSGVAAPFARGSRRQSRWRSGPRRARASASSVRDQRRATGSLRLAVKIGSGLRPAAVERRDQRVDRGEVAGLDQGAIEHERRDRRGPLASAPQIGEVGLGQARPVEPGAQQRRRLPPGLVAPEQAGGVGQELLRRCRGRRARRTARADGRPRPAASTSRQARDRAGRRPAAPRAGCSLRAADRRDLLQAVGPVAAAAEQAQDRRAAPWRRPARRRDRPTSGGRAGAGWRGAGSARLRAGAPAAAARQASSVSAAERNTMSPGRLAEIDRLAGVLRRRRAGRSAGAWRLHRLSRRAPPSTAARSSSRSPITTSRPARASPLRQARSK